MSADHDHDPKWKHDGVRVIPGNSLDPILGTVTINGEDGTDDFKVNDQGDTGPNTYTLTSTTVDRTGAAAALDRLRPHLPVRRRAGRGQRPLGRRAAHRLDRAGLLRPRDRRGPRVSGLRTVALTGRSFSFSSGAVL